MRTTLNANRWLWVIPLLLLAALLAGRRLNSWSFSSDEVSTMISAGARSFGPLTLAETLSTLNSASPDQAFGWTLLMNRWGAVVGWSTVAARALAWLIGLLTLALVYRAGRSLFGRQIGVIAVLLLVTSVFFISYLHIARAFTTVALLTLVTLWCYWRVALQVRASDRWGQAGLLLGGIGLLYAHYFASLLLPALGLFHLFLVRKDRRWWRVTLILAVVALSALPELAVLRQGLEWNWQRFGMNAGGKAMNPSEALLQILYNVSNSIVVLSQQLGPAVLLILLLSLLLLLWKRPSGAVRAAWFLGVMSLLMLALALIVNEFVWVLWPSRVRYLIGLWPPLALLSGLGLRWLGRRRQRYADWLLAMWLAASIVLLLRTPLYQKLQFYHLSHVHIADQALVQLAQADDFLLLDAGVMPTDRWIPVYYSNSRCLGVPSRIHYAGRGA